MYKHILLATDGSQLAKSSTKDAIALAKAIGAKITVITVIKPWHMVAPAEIMISFPEAEYLKGAKKQAGKILQETADAAQEAGVACQTRQMINEQPWRIIVDTAKSDNCDLIVMGSHGRTGLVKLVLGSETQKVLAHSKISVLVHR